MIESRVRGTWTDTWLYNSWGSGASAVSISSWNDASSLDSKSTCAVDGGCFQTCQLVHELQLASGEQRCNGAAMIGIEVCLKVIQKEVMKVLVF